MSHNHKHDDHHDHDHEHHHNHDGHNHNQKLNMILYLVGLVVFFIALFIEHDTISMILYLASLVLSGFDVIYEGISETVTDSIKTKRFKPNVHILMTIAAIGAIIIKEYREATLLILIFAGAHMLEHYAQDKSKREIKKLMSLNPVQARLIKADGTRELVDVETLKISDELIVLLGDQIPTDGEIVAGFASIDEAAITGESIPQEKEPGDLVYGSTINLNSDFVMKVTKESHDTVLSQMIKMVSQSQKNISRTATIIKKIEPIYVTIVLIIAPLFYLMTKFGFNWTHDESFYRTMVLLIGASPCALAVTDIPATLSAISNTASKGVLFKGGSYMSNLAQTKVVAFDKTGTITTGKPVVTDVYFTEDEKTFAVIVKSMEQTSNHPLAQAINNYYKDIKHISLSVTQEVGVGLVSTYNDDIYHISKPSNFSDIDKNIQKLSEAYQNEGKTVVYVAKNNEVKGLIAIQDVAKSNVKEVINYFKSQQIKTVMITGDTEKTALKVANSIGIDEVRANVLPTQKSEIINELRETYGTTIMIGDGINDAPALAVADLGVAMGEGTDIAIDTADIVLMKNNLEKLTYAHRVSKKLKINVIQNLIFSFLVVIFLLTMNMFGHMEMPIAVFFHEGSTLIVILNALRLLVPLKDKK